MLNLDFTEEQNMLREMVRGLCTQYAGDEAIRELEDDPTGYSTEMWSQLSELGLLGLMLPEAHGGSGSGPLDGVVLYEELGRSLAPTPHLESCVMSAVALLEAGSTEQISSLVPGIASGETIVVPAWLEPNNSFGPRGVQMRAEANGDGFVLNGTKEAVRFGSAADSLIVLARTGDPDDAVDLFLVDPNAEGVSLDQRMSISSDARYRVDFANVAVSAADRIGESGSGWATWSKVMDQVMVFTAALANGGNEYALEITVQYSKDREQFDKPLGAFQALAHDMANAKTAVDGAKLLNYEAAWALGQELDPNTEPTQTETSKSVTQLAAMSKLFSCNSYRDTTAMAQQIFGGVGFTIEYEIQMYFRRAKALQVSFNDTRRCEDLIAAEVLD